MNINNKKFLKRFLGYFIIAVISVSLNMFGYSYTINVLREQVKKTDEGVLENVSTMGKAYFDSIERTAVSFLSSNMVKRVSSKYFDNTDRSDVVNSILRDMALANDFAPYKSTNNYSILMKNREECLNSNMGISTFEVIFNVKYSDLYGSLDAWLDKVYSTRGVKYERITSRNGDNNLVVICYSPIISKNIASIVRVDLSYINKLFDSVADKYSYYALIDDHGDIITASSNCTAKNVEQIKYRLTAQGSEEMSRSFKGLRFVKFTDSNYYKEKVERVRIAFLLCFFLCLFVGMIIAYFLSKLSEKKEKVYVEEINKQKRFILKETLKKLIINGRINIDDEKLKELYLNSEGNKYILVMFDLWYLLDDDIKELNDDKLLVISEWIIDLIKCENNVVSVNDCVLKHKIILTIGTSNKKDIDFTDLLNKICSSAEQKFGVSIQCFVSMYTDNLLKINDLYKQIVERSNQILSDNNENIVIDCEKMQKQESIAYENEIKDVFLLALEKGDREKALEFAGKIVKIISKDSIDNGKIYVSALLNSIVEIVDKYRFDKDIESMISEILKFYNTDEYFEIKGNLDKFVNAVCDAKTKDVSYDTTFSLQQKRCKEIKEYIDSNYSDPLLNVNILALRFGVSRTWLSVQFKKTYDENISDYIVKYRISKAKELIAQNIPITRIINMVGFTNQSVFYRAFKKCEHITTTQYKELLLMQDEANDNV